MALLDGFEGQRHGQVSLAHARPTQQQDVDGLFLLLSLESSPKPFCLEEIKAIQFL